MEKPEHTYLALRAEEACLNGWPALRQITFDGWLLRFADGHTKRSNSINPVWPGARAAAGKIPACEAIYAAHGLPTIFRLSSAMPAGLDAVLDDFGYCAAEGATRVLHMDLAANGSRVAADAALSEMSPTGDWLGALARLQGQSERARTTHRKILEALAVPAVFAAVAADGDEFAAVAFGAVHDGLVCVNSVATDPRFRRRGLSRRAIAAVLAWARDCAGAMGAVVPVEASNAPASALYEGLGFRDEGFSYHYRRSSGTVGAPA